MINLIFSGRVGADAELTHNGACRFSLASTRKGYTKSDGTTVEEKTTWITVFKRNGQALVHHIKKGAYITIHADNLETNLYNEKASLQCNALTIEFGGVPKAENNQEMNKHLEIINNT